MKKLLSKIPVEYVIIIALIILSLFPLYYPGFLYTHDGIIHLFRTAGEALNFSNFDFFNRISYNMLDGFGYGWGIFYPPLSAMIPGIFMTLGFSVFSAEKIFILLASILAGVFGFLLFKEIFKKKSIALLVTILYVLSPYKINQIIIRGAMGEILLFTFLPLVFLGLIKILKGEYRYRYWLILGACGIVYSHTISTIYTAIFAALFLLFNVKQLCKKKTLLVLLQSTIMVLVISLPIFVPMLQHKNMDRYRISSIETDVADRVVHPGQLIGAPFETKEAESTPYLSENAEMNYMIGLTAMLILVLLPFVWKNMKKEKEIKSFLVYGILLLITIVMMTLPWIWNKIEILDVIQYPFRLLNFSVLFISIMAGYVLKHIETKENHYSILLFVMGFSFLFVLVIGLKAQFAKNLGGMFHFSQEPITEETDFGSLSFAIGYGHEYLPLGTTVEYLKSRGNDIVAVTGQITTSQYQNNKNVLQATIETKSQETVCEFPRIYYMGYTLTVDGKKVESHMNQNGFLEATITGEGTHQIKLQYTGTMLYHVLDAIALILVVGYGIFLIVTHNKVKKERQQMIQAQII